MDEPELAKTRSVAHFLCMDIVTVVPDHQDDQGAEKYNRSVTFSCNDHETTLLL